MSDRYKRSADYYEPFERRELAGHLWNDWLGIAGAVKLSLEPHKKHGRGTSPEELEITRGEFLYELVEKARTERLIPKVDLKYLPEDRRVAGQRYNDLGNKADALYKQIIESVGNLAVVPDEYPYYIVPENHPVLALLLELKGIMIEVSEILYSRRCEFFD